MNVRKRGLALLMCICMIFTLLPFSALADATESVNASKKPGDPSPLKIEYWCTNRQGKDSNENISKTLDSLNLTNNSYQPTYFKDVVPSTVTEGESKLTGMYWKTVILGNNNHQTTGNNDDKTDKGIEISSVVKLNNQYYYFTSNSTTPKQIKSTDQIVSYYKLVFVSCKEGYISGSDWGYSSINYNNGAVHTVTYKIQLLDAQGNEVGNPTTKALWYGHSTTYVNGISCTIPTDGKYVVYGLKVSGGNDTRLFGVVNGTDSGKEIPSSVSTVRGINYEVIYYLKPAATYELKYEWSSAPAGSRIPDTVSYDSGFNAPVDKNFTSESTAVDADGITWKFSGWYTDSAFTTPAGDTILMDSNKTLYGYWYAIYTVTYNYTGTVPEGAPVVPTDTDKYKAGDAVTVKSVGTVNGWTFDGWYLDGKKINGTTFEMPGENVTLTGSWTENAKYTYTVKAYWIGDKDAATGQPKDDAGAFAFATSEESYYEGTPLTVYTINSEYTKGYTLIGSGSQNITISAGDNVVYFYYYKNVTLLSNSGTFTYDEKPHAVSGFTAKTVIDPQENVASAFTNITAERTETEAGSYEVPFYDENNSKVDNVTDLVGLTDPAGLYKVTAANMGTLKIEASFRVIYKYVDKNGNEINDSKLTPRVDNNYYKAGVDNSITIADNPTQDMIPGYTFVRWYNPDNTNIVYTEKTIRTYDGDEDIIIYGELEPIVKETTYTIECYWLGDTANKLPADTDGQTYPGNVGDNTGVTEVEAPSINGYTFAKVDNIKLGETATGNIVKIYYYKNVGLDASDGELVYNGNERTFNATVTCDEPGVQFTGATATASGKDANSYNTAYSGVKLGDVDDSGFYIVTRLGNGKLTIIPRTVTIIGCDSKPKTITYDGKVHTFNDFSVAPTTDDTGLVNGHIVIAKDGKFIYTLTGKDPNTYDGIFDKDNIDIVAQVGNEFTSVLSNYKFDLKIGHMTIKKASTPVNPGIGDEIIVEITGNSDSVVYDGTEHSVKDYTVKISDPRYTEADFTFTGKAEARGINAGTYEMGLKAEQFKNTNARFTNVKFVIKADGVLTITPKELTITAGSKTEYGPTPVTCGEWTVSGLAAGDKVESVKITGIQSVPGSSPNVPSDAVIKNAKGEDVTKNYAIKYVNGTLTMLEVLNKEDHFNYIIGTPEGLSLPTANVTRAEVATIFFRLMTDDARAKFDSLDNNFSDVAKGKWYNRAISTLANAGIIKGDPAGTYRPGDPITRAEMAAIIARFGDFKEGGKTFNDISGHWAQKYIELAASNGWINGNPDGTFKPNNNITRAETVAMINRVLDRQTKDVSDLLPVSQMTNWSDNMDTAKWYYRDMQEATNNHKAERVGDSIYEKWTEKLPDIDWASYQI